MTGLVECFADPLGRGVWLRPGTSDQQVFLETFEGLYHVPPDWMEPPKSVLDLGANIGLVSAHYRCLWPDAEIVAVEPDPSSALLAARNSGCLVDVCAVGSWSGCGGLVGDVAYARRLVRDHDGGVIVKSFGELVGQYFGGSVDFVKVDVEGEEWGLLGGVPSGVRSLLVELHDRWEGDSDGAVLLGAQVLLNGSGFLSMPHRVHPRAVFAWRP